MVKIQRHKIKNYEMTNSNYLKRLHDCELVLFVIQFKCHSKNPLNTIEPQTVAGTRKSQPLESEVYRAKR